MDLEIGIAKTARRAYGFDDIAIVPSRRTRDPDDVDISWKLGDYRFELPLLASAMDGVVSPTTAGVVGRLGGLAVLNLEGIFTRYEDADEQLARIATLPKDVATREMQEIYSEPIKPELIAQRIREIKDQGVVCDGPVGLGFDATDDVAPRRTRVADLATSSYTSDLSDTIPFVGVGCQLGQFVREDGGDEVGGAVVSDPKAVRGIIVDIAKVQVVPDDLRVLSNDAGGSECGIDWHDEGVHVWPVVVGLG